MNSNCNVCEYKYSKWNKTQFLVDSCPIKIKFIACVTLYIQSDKFNFKLKKKIYNLLNIQKNLH